jgi:AraC family transcriptional regulator, transcriptional activator of pobA
MKRYLPLLLQKVNIRVPGLHIRRLALHRHLPETNGVHPHSHRHAQCLLYLSGGGRQQAGRESQVVRAGTAVFLPPGVEHAFCREANRRPICLVIDFDWRHSRGRPAVLRMLPESMLREAREQISFITQGRRPGAPSPLQDSTAILRLLTVLLRGLGLEKERPRPSGSPILRRVDRALDAPQAAEMSLAELSENAGYQHDYLNRILKREIGLTLGQHRARRLLRQAQLLLKQGHPVTRVAERAGFNDPNYFSRWFRKQTGLSPRSWRAQG